MSPIFNVPFNLLVEMPLMGNQQGPGSGIGQAIQELYNYYEGVAITVIGVFFVADVLWTLWTEG